MESKIVVLEHRNRLSYKFVYIVIDEYKLYEIEEKLREHSAKRFGTIGEGEKGNGPATNFAVGVSMTINFLSLILQCCCNPCNRGRALRIFCYSFSIFNLHILTM